MAPDLPDHNHPKLWPEDLHPNVIFPDLVSNHSHFYCIVGSKQQKKSPGSSSVHRLLPVWSKVIPVQTANIVPDSVRPHSSPISFNYSARFHFAPRKSAHLNKYNEGKHGTFNLIQLSKLWFVKCGIFKQPIIGFIVMAIFEVRSGNKMRSKMIQQHRWCQSKVWESI